MVFNSLLEFHISIIANFVENYFISISTLNFQFISLSISQTKSHCPHNKSIRSFSGLSDKAGSFTIYFTILG